MQMPCAMGHKNVCTASSPGRDYRGLFSALVHLNPIARCAGIGGAEGKSSPVFSLVDLRILPRHWTLNSGTDREDSTATEGCGC